MYRIGVPLWIALLVCSGAATAATRTYIVTDFDTVRLEAPLEVAVETGRGVTARGEGDREMLERIDLVVSARTLTIRLKPSPFEGRPQKAIAPTRLLLSAPSLRRIQHSGSGTMTVRGLDRSRADIVTAGSGSLTITAIATDQLSLTQMGSAMVSMSGSARNANLRVSGSGGADLAGLKAADLELTLEGSANVAAMAERSARLTVTGPGSVTITGTPACTVRHAGSGLVACGGGTY